MNPRKNRPNACPIPIGLNSFVTTFKSKNLFPIVCPQIPSLIGHRKNPIRNIPKAGSPLKLNPPSSLGVPKNNPIIIPISQ